MKGISQAGALIVLLSLVFSAGLVKQFGLIDIIGKFIATLWLFTKIMIAFLGFLIGFLIIDRVIVRPRKLPIEFSVIGGIWFAVLFWYFAGILFALGLITGIIILILSIFTPLGILILTLLHYYLKRKK